MRNFPTFMARSRGCPGGLPNFHIAVVSPDMGAATVRSPAATRRRQERDPPVHAARSLHRDEPAARRDVHLERRRRRELHRQPRGRVQLHRRAGRGGCGFEHQFAAITRALGADGQAAARRESGLPAPRGLPGDRDDHERGRLLRGAGSAALRHHRQHQHGFAARAAGQLSVQRVRPPLRRRAAEPPRAEQLHERHESYQSCVPAGRRPPHHRRRDRRPASRRSSRPDDQIMVAAITGPTAPYPVRVETPHRRRDTGPWPSIQHSCMAGDSSFADPVGASHRARARVRRQRPPAVDLRRRVRPGADVTSRRRSADFSNALHRRSVANRSGTAPGPTARS